jgi:ribosomal protein S6--L-glutamate ligase
MKEEKFIILGSKNYANRRMIHEFEQLGHKAVILDPSRLLPFVNDKKRDRMYVASVKSDQPKRLYKKSVAGIVPRIGGGLSFYAKSVEHLNKNMGIPTTATAEGLLAATDKIRTIQLLSQAGIKTPKTFAVKKVQNLKWVVEQLGGFPVVAKTITGSQGVGVFILTELLSASTGLDAFTAQGNNLLLQQFIETGEDKEKHDFRAVVVNGEVVASIQRNSSNGDFRTNASIKENCEGVELSDEMKKIAINAAAACGLEVAGVDLAVDINTNQIYVYEVNGNMNYKSTEKYSKKNVAKAIAQYMIDKTKKREKEEERLEKADSSFTSYIIGLHIQHRNDDHSLEIYYNGSNKDGIPFLEFPKDDDDEEELEDFEASMFSISHKSAKQTLWNNVKAAESKPKRVELPYFLTHPRNEAARRKWEKENL